MALPTWKNPFTPEKPQSSGWGPVKVAPDGRTDGSRLVKAPIAVAPSSSRSGSACGGSGGSGGTS